MTGFAICGSFCNMENAIKQLEILIEKGEEVIPIVSYNVYSTNTRFGKASQIIEKIEQLCNRNVICSLQEAEPLGPRICLDVLCVCPCTGNTLAKLANGISDTPVCLACKAHMRNERPLVIALASNDSLSANAENLGKMLVRRNVFFVPMCQDDAHKKPRSLVCDFSRLSETIENAKQYRQVQPLLF